MLSLECLFNSLKHSEFWIFKVSAFSPQYNRNRPYVCLVMPMKPIMPLLRCEGLTYQNTVTFQCTIIISQQKKTHTQIVGEQEELRYSLKWIILWEIAIRKLCKFNAGHFGAALHI